MEADDSQPALFDTEPAPPPGGVGRVEQLLTKAIEAARQAQVLVDEDLGLVGSALAGARALDSAERAGGVKAGYLIAQLLTPYRETCQALRLPAAVMPAENMRSSSPATGEDLSSFLGDHFGTPGS